MVQRLLHPILQVSCITAAKPFAILLQPFCGFCPERIHKHPFPRCLTCLPAKPILYQGYPAQQEPVHPDGLYCLGYSLSHHPGCKYLGVWGDTPAKSCSSGKDTARQRLACREMCSAR